MLTINYAKIQSKMENTLKIWAKRSLTVIGKIRIINTLIIPQMVYKLTALPTPPDGIMNKFKAMIREFLLGRATPAIKYDKLIQSCHDLEMYTCTDLVPFIFLGYQIFFILTKHGYYFNGSWTQVSVVINSELHWF